MEYPYWTQSGCRQIFLRQGGAFQLSQLLRRQPRRTDAGIPDRRLHGVCQQPQLALVHVVRTAYRHLIAGDVTADGDHGVGVLCAGGKDRIRPVGISGKSRSRAVRFSSRTAVRLLVSDTSGVSPHISAVSGMLTAASSTMRSSVIRFALLFSSCDRVKRYTWPVPDRSRIRLTPYGFHEDLVQRRLTQVEQHHRYSCLGQPGQQVVGLLLAGDLQLILKLLPGHDLRPAFGDVRPGVLLGFSCKCTRP